MTRLVLSLYLFVTCTSAFSQNIKDFTELPKTKWKIKSGPIFGSPVIDGNTVFYASEDSVLHAIDLVSGKEKWKFSFYGASRSTPYVSNDNVFVISEDGLLYNVNKNTGKLTWQFVTPQGVLGERKYDRADYYQSSPVVHNDKVFFGMGDCLYVVNVSNGTMVWNYKTGNLVHTKPAISNEKVIFGSYDGNVYALNNQTGSLIWKFKTVGHRYFPNGEAMGDPVVSKNQVFIGARDYNFYAIEVNTGYCHWNKQFPKGWALSATVLKDSVLYLGTSDDYVMIAMDPRFGTESWRTAVKYNIFGGMALSESMGYVGTLMGKVFGIDLKTGAIKWTFEGDGYRNNKKKYFNTEDKHPDRVLEKFDNFDEVVKMYHDLGGIFSTPAVTSDHIVYTGADGFIYCLGR
jgi:eukaryotic-like serine/threonine-protein kinase